MKLETLDIYFMMAMPGNCVFYPPPPPLMTWILWYFQILWLLTFILTLRWDSCHASSKEINFNGKLHHYFHLCHPDSCFLVTSVNFNPLILKNLTRCSSTSCTLVMSLFPPLFMLCLWQVLIFFFFLLCSIKKKGEMHQIIPKPPSSFWCQIVIRWRNIREGSARSHLQ